MLLSLHLFPFSNTSAKNMCVHELFADYCLLIILITVWFLFTVWLLFTYYCLITDYCLFVSDYCFFVTWEHMV